MMDLKNVIEHIQGLLGTSYLQIGEEFKFLRNAVETSISDSEKIVKDFRSTVESNSPESFKNILLQTEYAVTDAWKKYSEFSGELKSIFNTINKSFNVISEMNNPIEQIIDSAELMELLALNSMVVAIQAGKEGGGFTFITEELQKNAKVIFSLAKEIDSRRKNVIDNYNYLREKSDELLINQKKIENHLSNTLENDFKRIRLRLTESIEFLETINTKASGLEPLVMRIMEGLQNQDIIRQSLDHVFLSLNEMERNEKNCSEDEKTVINHKLIELCLYVTNEVREKLRHDIEIVKSSTDEIEKHLYSLEKTKNEYYDIHLRTGKSEKSLISTIEAISYSMTDLMTIINKNIEHENNILQIKNNLFSAFTNLNNANRKFEEPLTLFKNIIIMARIEIARQPVIRNVEISIASIYSEIGKIFNSAGEIEKINNEVIGVNNLVETEFANLLKSSSNFVSHFRGDIEILLDLARNSTEIIKRIIGSLVFLNDDYIDSFQRLRNLNKKIHTAEEYLLNLDQKMNRLYEIVEKSYNILDKKIAENILNNDNIKELLNKFTIFRHKGKLLGIEENAENTSAADSSVTLF